jgi:hypothetical protein
MTCAAILSLAEFREAQLRTEVRQRLHDRFCRWLQRVEDQVKEPTPSLEALTEAVIALRQELTPAVTEGLVEQAHRAALEQRTAAGSRCGPALSARDPQERTVETLVGAVPSTRRRSAHASAISSGIRSDWTTGVPAREAIPWGGTGLNRRTRASAMHASSGQARGGT